MASGRLLERNTRKDSCRRRYWRIRPTVGRGLLEAGHEVVALGRDTKAVIPETQPLTANALDRDALLRAAAGVTHGRGGPSAHRFAKVPAKFRDMELTNELRTTGTRNLLELAHVVGAQRLVTQSMVPGYGFVDHGDRVLTEDDPFGQARGLKTDPVVAAMRSTEQQVFEAAGIEGIALRYGAFYGLAGSDGVLAALRAGKLPTTADGGGTMSWIRASIGRAGGSPDGSVNTRS